MDGLALGLGVDLPLLFPRRRVPVTDERLRRFGGFSGDSGGGISAASAAAAAAAAIPGGGNGVLVPLTGADDGADDAAEAGPDDPDSDTLDSA